MRAVSIIYWFTEYLLIWYVDFHDDEAKNDNDGDVQEDADEDQ